MEFTTRWVRDTSLGRWRDSFFLTGMTVGQDTIVWRLSFEHANSTSNITTTSTDVNVSGVALEAKIGVVMPCELSFHRATMLNISTVAPAGVWIVQHGTTGGGAMPKVEVKCGSMFAAEWPLQH